MVATKGRRTDVYSQYGIEWNRYVEPACALKVAIDPPRSYYEQGLDADLEEYERVLLVHGCEPPEINDVSDRVIERGRAFSRVLSFDENVLAAIPGSERFAFGSCWVLDESEEGRNPFDTGKEFEVSFIRSGKRLLEGHRFRDRIDAALAIERSFRVNYPQQRIDSKRPLFSRAMFHVAAENSRHPNYFTEKLIDCLASYTVPIYWGCPNIGDYFDREGILTFETEEDLNRILDDLSPADYLRRIPALLRNYALAVPEYAFFHRRLERYIAREHEEHRSGDGARMRSGVSPE